MALVRTKITSAPQSMLVNNMSMSTYRQIARQRQISAEFRHSAIISLASERLFSTLLNTLNCIKPKNFGQDLCRATTEVDLDGSRQRCIDSQRLYRIDSLQFSPFQP
jgi:hypothetical protein